MTNSTRKGWGVSVTPRPLFTPGIHSVPIVQEAVWAPGPVWTGAENLAPSGIRSSELQPLAQSLYRLSYPAHGLNMEVIWKKTKRSTFDKRGMHCATIREVAGSIPDGVVGIFHWHNPSGRTMALGLTQPLTEISTRDISLGVNAVGA